MGKAKEKKTKMRVAILSALEITALLAVTAMAPNVLQLLKFTKIGKRRHQRTYYINQAVGRLRHQGLIEFVTNNHGIKCARLTVRGKEELNRFRLGEVAIATPRHWDRKYRLVIFDIKEWKRGVRDKARRWLEHLGFIRLQNSAWVHPYECQEIVALLKAHFKVGKEILYLTVDSIENDAWLKREFGLE